MKNKELGSLVQRLAALFRPDKQCFAYSYKLDIKELSQTNWDSPGVKYGTRQWVYQTCTEFGYYQTTDSSRQPFGAHVSLQFYLDVYCKDVYGITAKTITNGVAQSNQIYGSRGLQSNWLVMPNGNIDPWHALSILHNINPTSISVFMNGTSHCQDMGYHSPKDSAALVAGRQKISSQIGVILAQPNNNN